MTTVDRLAIRIRLAREEARLTQEELAEAIGVSDKSVSAYEVGRIIPPVDNLKKIADSTDKPMNFFTDENIDGAVIEGKLSHIEKELAEIRKLLQKSST